jgi:hypothetical protein
MTAADTADKPADTPTWRCFHCDFETSDRAEAQAHFGDDSDEPSLCIFWATMDDAARLHEYRQMVLELNATREEVFRLNAAIENESSDGMRAFRELESRMRLELRRAEEDGYARGLRDAQEHPEELGLCVTSETARRNARSIGLRRVGAVNPCVRDTNGDGDCERCHSIGCPIRVFSRAMIDKMAMSDADVAKFRANAEAFTYSESWLGTIKGCRSKDGRVLIDVCRPQ